MTTTRMLRIECNAHKMTSFIYALALGWLVKEYKPLGDMASSFVALIALILGINFIAYFVCALTDKEVS